MSKISQDFINNLGSLYEEIHVKGQDFLNEESEYYDKETSELVEDILSTISVSMVCEGYSAEAIVGFLADSSEEDIVEKYLSFDENILTESAVSEEHIVEQLEIFDTAINEGLGSLAGKVATGVGKLLAKRAPALKSAGPLTQKAATRLAMKGKPTLFTKAKVGLERAIGPKGRKAVQAVKDVASKAKAALPGVAKGALLAGTGVLTGYAGAKLAGAGSGASGAQDSPKPSPSGAPSSTKDDFLKGSALAKLGGKEGRIKNGEFRTMAWSPESKARYAKATKSSESPKPTPSAPSSPSAKPASTSKKSTPTSTPAKPKPTGSAMDQWAAANPKLAAAKAERDRTRGTSATTNPLMKDMKANLPAPSSPSTSTATTGFDLAKKGIDLSKKNSQQKQTVNSSYEYDAYDLVLEYLFSNGHVDNLSEAHYVMLEMDEKAVQNIIEEHENLILSEKVSEWVNQLLDEGYDLSEYSWDDIIEYYVNNI